MARHKWLLQAIKDGKKPSIFLRQKPNEVEITEPLGLIDKTKRNDE